MVRPAALLLPVLLLPGARAAAQDKPPSDPKAPLSEQVEQAVHFGTEWLKKQAFVPGCWWTEIGGPGPGDTEPKEDYFVFPTGCTSLALYALLKSGVPKDDPVIKKGFQWLMSTSGGITRDKVMRTSYRVPNGTYELAMIVLALEARTRPRYPSAAKLPAEDQAWMKEVLDALLKRWTRTKGWRYGVWTGNDFQKAVGGDSDVCATSMAVSALLAGERCGIRQRDEVYADVLLWLLRLQQAEGPEVARKGTAPPASDRARGWGYLGSSGKDVESAPTGSMTASALATIHACTTTLQARKSRLLTKDLLARAEKARADGLAWLDRAWAVDRNPGVDGYHHFHLMAIERLAGSAGMDTLAGRRWFEEGAAVLLESQDPKGCWVKKERDGPLPNDVLDTAFALLFLSRGTPVAGGN